MEIIDAIILGIVQGLTEFLPVSSSGHIAIANELLKTNYNPEEKLLLNIVLHAATAISTIYIFRKDLSNIFRGLFKFKQNDEFLFSVKIIISMIPAIFVGIFLEEDIKQLFGEKIILVGIMLIVTAIFLFLADKSKPTNKNVSFLGAIIIGISQAIAILPGISRSGATIATSVFLGTDKEKSARFSFLMAIPIILGATSKKIYSLNTNPGQPDEFSYLPLLFGFIAAFIVGLFACKWMIQLVKNSQLKYFSYYCIFVGIAIIFKYIIYA